MMKDLVSMHEIQQVLAVAEAQGIPRHRVVVPLLREADGSVRISESGEVLITLPRGVPLEDWMPTLTARLASLKSEKGGGQ